ncbi:polysaccharide lyase family 8 super-sandwich domain-containing protein [Oceaniferula spumae]
MKIKTTLALLPALTLICSGVAHGDEKKGASGIVASFETGVPENFAAQGGKLSVSGDHILDGSKALKWDFKNGDAFTVKTGPLGNVNVWTGYGNYSRSAVIFPLYLAQKGPGHLLVEIRAGEETAATFEVPLVHVGWQKPVFHYSWNSKLKWVNGKLKDKLDNFRISAHGVTGENTAYFDAIFFNDPRDFRDARGPITQSWEPAVHDFSKLPAPTAEDLAKVDAIFKIFNPDPNPNIKREHWEKRVASLKKSIQDQGLQHGNPVKNHYKNFGFLNSIANDWLRCADPEMRKELATCFHTVNDWMQEQGLVVNGSIGKVNNYGGRLYVDAITKMRGPLKEHGNLKTSIDYLKWSYSYDDHIFGDNHHVSMDYFHNEAARLMRIALTHGDPVVRWHHVNQFRDAFGKQLIVSIEPDGGIFHHGFHYYAYGSMGMNDASWLAAVLSRCGMPVPRKSLDSIRNAVEAMIWYSGRTTLWSLNGRNAAGTQGAPTGTIKNLAEAYAPYNDGKPDPYLMSNFLRLAGNHAKNPAYADITPAASPNGNFTMPSAALAVHRRDDWLAGIKAYSKYAGSGESYANANRHGLYMSMGQLELLTHPKELPTVLGSGTRPDEGYDWTAIEGATTIHCPIKGIANGNGSRNPKSGEIFVGGLTNGHNGLFAFTFNTNFTHNIVRNLAADPKQAPKPDNLTALKTWFCFDNRIICLGSNISISGVDYPVRTNLFQKFLTAEHSTTQLNGESLTLADQAITRDETQAATLIDPYGNAYITPAETPVHLRISEQKSRNNNDTKDTTGKYSTAWIEHGKNPKDAAYEYAVLVQPTDEDLKSFTAKQPYQVLKKDATAHIVHDAPSNTTGYVIFQKEAELPTDRTLKSVAQPCLVMIAEHADHFTVSLTNPDARLQAKEPQPVTITLNGELTSADESSPATLETKDGSTQLTVPVLHGESVIIRLKKPKPLSNTEAETEVKDSSAKEAAAPAKESERPASPLANYRWIIAGLLIVAIAIVAKLLGKRK